MAANKEEIQPHMWYIEMPSADVQQSVRFYEGVFGWNIRHRDTVRPSFDANAGAVSGAWTTGRKPAADGGPLIYVWVPSVNEALTRVESHGGEIVEGTRPDSPGTTCYIAKFRDPSGNLIGVYHEESASPA